MSGHFSSQQGGHGEEPEKAPKAPTTGEKQTLLVEWNGAAWVPVLSPISGFTLTRAGIEAPLRTGVQNIALGSTLAALTTGQFNTFMGETAGPAITSGECNTGIGAYALRDVTTGNFNTAVGFEAGAAITEGQCHTAVGVGAMRAGGGFENTAFGFEALAGKVTGDFNVAVGGAALAATTTGSDNVAMGTGAMRYNLEGEHNTAIGFTALWFTGSVGGLAGSFNTGIGSAALYQNTEGKYNAAVGHEALHGNTTGDYNAALGAYALTAAAATNFNTAIGYGALQATTTGGENVAIGAQAGSGNKAGHGNVFLGRAAGLKELGSNMLYIANTETAEPLILGVFPNAELALNATKLGFFKKAPVAQPAKPAGTEAEKLAAVIKALEELGLVA